MKTLRGMGLLRSVVARALAVAPLSLVIGGAPWAADLNDRFAFDIAPQKLATALVELSRQANTQVVSDAKAVAAMDSAGISGEMSLNDALRQLLAGTHLEYKSTSNGVVAVGPFGSGAAAKPAADQPMEVEEIVVRATKIDTPVIEAPQAISIISRDQMEMRGVQSMTEALRYVPGTVVDNYGYEPRGYEYVILRGFDALYTGNYRDGLNQATGLYFASFVTEPYGVDGIEVIRGPASALFGQSDAGGIVNRLSKRPGTHVVPEVEVQVGNFNRKQLALDVGGSLTSDQSLMYRLVGVGLDSDTQGRYPQGDRPSMDHVYFAPSLLWQPSENTSITFLTDMRKGNSKGYSLYARRPDGSFSGVLQGEPNFIKYDQDQFSLGYQFEHKFNERWTLRQNFRYARADVDAHEIFPLDFLDERTLMRYSVATQERLDQTLLDTQLHARLATGAAEHNLLLGVDVSRVDADLKLYMGTAPDLDLYDPVYGLPVGAPDFLLIQGTQENRQTGVYLQDQIHINERWIVTLGSRYDWTDSETVDQLAASTIEFRDKAFTGRAGLTYRFANGLAPYVSYTQSFLPQGGIDFNNNPFKPSKGEQYEIGLKYQTPSGRSLLTAALFDLTKTNILTPDLDHEFFSRTSGERRSRGLELEAQTQLTDAWHVSAQYTYLDAEVTKSNDIDLGKRPIQIPEHTAALWTDYAFSGALQGFSLSGGVRFVGERFDDWANIYSSPSYTLFDAAVRYETGRWRVQLNSANLFDKRYFASGSRGSGYYMGSERTVTLSLKYRWGI